MASKFAKLLMASTFLIGGASAAQAAAGFIALEGSDATALHHDAQYTPQLFSYLKGASSLPVLVFGGEDLSAITGVPTVTVSSLTGVDLSLYSALYVEAPFGCCTSDPNAVNGFGAAINTFIAAGGNFSIENYMGGDFDGVVPGGAGQAGNLSGNSTIYGTTCTDGEVVNANGLAKGFTQPPVDGCWSHQAYQSSYWLPLGYISLMDSDPSFSFADGTHIGSSLLAFGGTLGTVSDVPEPLTLSLFSVGLVGAAAMRRKAKKA
jgi:hypothetical protein